MMTTDVRLFMEVTTRQTEEAFRRQMNASQPTACGHSKAVTQPRELWWSQPEGMPRISRAEKERNCE